MVMLQVYPSGNINIFCVDMILLLHKVSVNDIHSFYVHIIICTMLHQWVHFPLCQFQFEGQLCLTSTLVSAINKPGEAASYKSKGVERLTRN